MVEQALRYSRHIALAGVGERGQARIGAGHALIIGMGGLGCPAAQYLAASGVGTLVLNDFDRVDVTNLQRQILFSEAVVGQFKVQAAADALAALNSEVSLHTLDTRLQGEALQQAIRAADVVLDCSDNFGTRFAVNEACVQSSTPLVSGAAIRMEAQLAVFRPDLPESPCYRCLYDETHVDVEDCSGSGVLAPLVGVIGSMMAAEALKVLLGAGHDSPGRLWIYDALTLDWRAIRLKPDKNCPVCASVTG